MTPVYIIAEAGVNHNGDPALARRLVDAARAAGADAVKFQTFRTEKILTRDTAMADYQQANTGSAGSQFAMVEALELGFDDFAALQAHARAIGIDFLSTPDDEDSLDFLADELALPLLKIGSGEVTNLPYLRRIAAKQRPMVLSTGMSTLGEVERAVRTIQAVSARPLTLLHCTTNYPCPAEEVNLRAMQTLGQAFGLPVGYSDHTLGSAVPVAAAALGAVMLEKHLTLDTAMAGPDHAASADPAGFAEMVRQVRAIEKALGSGIKWPNPSEQKILPLVRRRIVAARPLQAGEVLTEDCLAYKRAGHGLFAEATDALLGKTINQDLAPDTPLDWPLLRA